MLFEYTRRTDDFGLSWRRTLAARKPLPPRQQGPGETPSLLQKAVNFGAAVVQHAASGFARATSEERSRRLALCQVCEHYVDRRCAQCGCAVKDEAAFLDKLGWAEQKCPIGRW